MALDATVGGENANSYLTVEEADAYFTERMHSTDWSASVDKEAALITCTRLLDRNVKWSGVKASETQALDWPRFGMVDRDGYYVDEDIVPEPVKQAVCELAYFMLGGDRTEENPLKGLKSVKIDTLAIEADRWDFPKVIPDAVWAALGEYGLKPSSSEVRLIRC